MKIGVVGVYQTKFGELWDKSLADLISESITGCILDARIDKSDIQSLYIGNMLASLGNNQQHLSSLVSQILNLNVPITRVEAACASGGMAIFNAVNAIKSGVVDNALVLGVEKMTDLDSSEISKALMNAADDGEFLHGMTFPGLYALLANKYCKQFGLSEVDIAKAPVKNHYHAQFNKKAQYPFAITTQQVLNSPKVADPLKMLDCSPITDGGAAVFLASDTWIHKHMARNGVYLSASAMASDSVSLSNRDSLVELKATKQASILAYSQANLSPKDISCAEVHDCFSIAEVLAIEDLGFYPKGDGSHYLDRKNSYLGGKKPINTSGGLKACGHPVGATGVKQIVEATRQLRYEADGRQVDEAKAVLTHNIGGSGGTAVVNILTN